MNLWPFSKKSKPAAQGANSDAIMDVVPEHGVSMPQNVEDRVSLLFSQGTGEAMEGHSEAKTHNFPNKSPVYHRPPSVSGDTHLEGISLADHRPLEEAAPFPNPIEVGDWPPAQPQPGFSTASAEEMAMNAGLQSLSFQPMESASRPAEPEFASQSLDAFAAQQPISQMAWAPDVERDLAPPSTALEPDFPMAETPSVPAFFQPEPSMPVSSDFGMTHESEPIAVPALEPVPAPAQPISPVFMEDVPSATQTSEPAFPEHGPSFLPAMDFSLEPPVSTPMGESFPSASPLPFADAEPTLEPTDTIANFETPASFNLDEAPASEASHNLDLSWTMAPPTTEGDWGASTMDYPDSSETFDLSAGSEPPVEDLSAPPGEPLVDSGVFMTSSLEDAPPMETFQWQPPSGLLDDVTEVAPQAEPSVALDENLFDPKPESDFASFQLSEENAAGFDGGAFAFFTSPPPKEAGSDEALENSSGNVPSGNPMIELSWANPESAGEPSSVIAIVPQSSDSLEGAPPSLTVSVPVGLSTEPSMTGEWEPQSNWANEQHSVSQPEFVQSEPVAPVQWESSAPVEQAVSFVDASVAGEGRSAQETSARSASFPVEAIAFTQQEPLAGTPGRPVSLSQALERFESQVILDETRFLKRSIDSLVDRYFANKEAEERRANP